MLFILTNWHILEISQASVGCGPSSWGCGDFATHWLHCGLQPWWSSFRSAGERETNTTDWFGQAKWVWPVFSRHIELGPWASLLLTEGREVQSKLRDEIRLAYGLCWIQPWSWCSVLQNRSFKKKDRYGERVCFRVNVPGQTVQSISASGARCSPKTW